MSDSDRSINPNTADLETLTLLPGVGETLARRIIEHRPFETVDDLTRVPGLGAQSLGRLQPMIELSEEDESEIEATSAPGTVRSEEASGDSDTADRPEVQQMPSGYATRSQVLGISAASTGVGVVISILLMLSILIGVNRTLNVSRHSTVRELMASVAQIETALEEMDTTLQGVENRLALLEGLSGRMTELESATADLDGEVQSALTQVQQMRNRVGEVSLQIEALARQSQNQATFFERLQALLNDVFGGPIEENAQ